MLCSGEADTSHTVVGGAVDWYGIFWFTFFDLVASQLGLSYRNKSTGIYVYKDIYFNMFLL